MNSPPSRPGTRLSPARFGFVALALLLPVVLASCYTQVRDPSLSGLGEPPRREAPGGNRGPNDGTLILVVDHDSMIFEQWVLVAPSPWPGAGRDLEIETEGGGDLQTVSFHYPDADAMIFEASTVWGGSGRIEFPRQWRAFDTLPKGGHEATPTWVRLYSPRGPGERIHFDELPYAHERGQDLLDLWYSISDRELVSDWVEGGAWVGVFFYRPSSGMPVGTGDKWIVFIRR